MAAKYPYGWLCWSALSCAFALLSSVRRSKLGSSSALAFAFALVKYCLRRGLLGVLRGTLQHACSSSAAPRKLAAAVIVSSHAAAAAGGEASSRGGASCGSGALRSRTTHQPAARPPQPQPSGSCRPPV